MNSPAEHPVSPDPDGPGPEQPGVEVAPGVRVAPAVLRFAFSRSGGPGGQNVNKLSTKAELRVRVGDLPIRDRARDRLRRAAGRRVTDADELLIVCETERSQARNRAECMDKLREILVAAMAEPKVRRKTRPSRGAVERRLEAKRSRSKTKRRRSERGDE